MFDYEGIDDDMILALEDDFDKQSRITAVLVMINGIRKGIIESEEGLIGIKNILVSLTN